MRLVLPLLAAFTLAGCSTIHEAFTPADRPWPIPATGAVRRSEDVLRVHGASSVSKALAEEDARRNLELWLWSLDLTDDLAERRRLIKSLLASPEAQPVPPPMLSRGFDVVIELHLSWLQQRLGTHYD